jgi:hypothetical protein
MKEQLRAFLHALSQRQNQIVMDYFFLSALAWNWVNTRSTNLYAVLNHTLAAFSVFAVFAYALTIVLYLFYPSYLDQVQATVATISWLWMKGQELYPNWTTGKIYGLVYGPVLFFINGIALLLSPSIIASKLPGVLSFVAALSLIWILLKWKTADSIAALFLLASVIMLCVPFDVLAYSNRAEPFLILFSVLALLLAFRSSALFAAVGIGVLAGVATGLKIHGFIYMVPAAAAALARVKTPRGRRVMAINGCAWAVAAAFLPYVEKGVSIIGHLRFLRLSFDSGFVAHLFIDNLLFAVILTAPIIVIWIGWKPALNPPDRWLLAVLGPSIALITMVGANAGAGEYHLLPFAPTCIFAVAAVCESSKIETAKIASFIFVSYFLAYSPALFLNIGHLYQLGITPERQQIAELKTLLASYPEGQIGISDNQHYHSYFYRVFSVWSGRPLDVDFSVWIDLAYAGVDERYIMRFIKRCNVPTWIIPIGTPFTMLNLYDGLPLFSESFRTTFLTNYQKVQTGYSYQVWKCKLEPLPRTVPESHVTDPVLGDSNGTR